MNLEPTLLYRVRMFLVGIASLREAYATKQSRGNTSDFCFSFLLNGLEDNSKNRLLDSCAAASPDFSKAMAWLLVMTVGAGIGHNWGIGYS